MFSEKTYNALLTRPEMNENIEDTAIFLNIVIIWWKILNVKARCADIRHTDPLEVAISSPDDNRLNIIVQFGDMALNVCAEQGKRIKQLPRDTATAIHQTCYGVVDLCRHLLAISHRYVLLGQFTNDHLEKEFGKLREGCGGTSLMSNK